MKYKRGKFSHDARRVIVNENLFHNKLLKLFLLCIVGKMLIFFIQKMKELSTILN